MKNKIRKRRSLVEQIYYGGPIKQSVFDALDAQFAATGKFPKWANAGLTEELGDAFDALSGLNQHTGDIKELIWRHLAHVYMNDIDTREAIGPVRRKRAAAALARRRKKTRVEEGGRALEPDL